MPRFKAGSDSAAAQAEWQAANESSDSSSESGKQQQSNVATEMAPRSSTKAAASTKTYVPGSSAAAAQAAGVSQVEAANPEVTVTTNVTYSLYRFVGGVDNIGLLSSVQWTEAEYATESDISDFKTTMDVDLISEDNLDGMLDATSPAGMTPMMTRLKQAETAIIAGTEVTPIESTLNLTNESLYAFASDEIPYPTNPVTNDNGFQTYNLSTDEINSLKQQFDLAQETDHVDDGTAWGGIYGVQFSSYVDELTQDLVNHMGVLLKPVINFHKTKNNKITDNEISSLGRFDSSLSKISINTTTTTTDSEYES